MYSIRIDRFSAARGFLLLFRTLFGILGSNESLGGEVEGGGGDNPEFEVRQPMLSPQPFI